MFESQPRTARNQAPQTPRLIYAENSSGPMNYTEPFIPTPEDIIPKMLNLASVKAGETVFDLGSGDGRILIAAARDFNAKAIGVETRKKLVTACRERVKELGLS